MRPWRRRRPPASPGVVCGQGNGHFSRAFLSQDGIPVDRNAKKFLPAVIAVQEMHCNAKNVHLGLPWGAAGAMDGFERSVACVELNQMLRRLNIRVVVVGFDFVQGPMTPLQVQIFPSFKDAYSAYQV